MPHSQLPAESRALDYDGIGQALRLRTLLDLLRLHALHQPSEGQPLSVDAFPLALPGIFPGPIRLLAGVTHNESTYEGLLLSLNPHTPRRLFCVAA